MYRRHKVDYFQQTTTKSYSLTEFFFFPHQEQLWSALKAGQIDMVVSDHSPCTTDLKKLDSGDFTQAWGGISSLQFGTDSSKHKCRIFNIQ